MTGIQTLVCISPCQNIKITRRFAPFDPVNFLPTTYDCQSFKDWQSFITQKLFHCYLISLDVLLNAGDQALPDLQAKPALLVQCDKAINQRYISLNLETLNPFMRS